MKIRFWGVRGSIASPGPKTVRYGGNTTCIEVRTDANELIIIDAGTGIFPLSQALLAVGQWCGTGDGGAAAIQLFPDP